MGFTILILFVDLRTCVEALTHVPVWRHKKTSGTVDLDLRSLVDGVDQGYVN